MQEGITVEEASDPTIDARKKVEDKQETQTWRFRRVKGKGLLGEWAASSYNSNMGILAPLAGWKGIFGIVTSTYGRAIGGLPQPGLTNESLLVPYQRALAGVKGWILDGRECEVEDRRSIPSGVLKLGSQVRAARFARSKGINVVRDISGETLDMNAPVSLSPPPSFLFPLCPLLFPLYSFLIISLVFSSSTGSGFRI